MFATAFVNLYTADVEAGLRFYRAWTAHGVDASNALLRDPDGNLVEIVAKVA